MLEEPLKTQTAEAAQVITDTSTRYTQYITHKLTPKLERYRDLSTNQQTTRQKEAATTGIQLVQSTTRDITETTDEMQSVVTRLNEAATTDEALSALAHAQERRQRWKNRLMWIMAMYIFFITPVDKALKSDV